MRVCYIAGKFLGATAWDVAENVRAAERWALEVAKQGAAPLCPHTMNQHFYGQLSEERFWLPATLELLARCDGALFIPGWHESRGALAEHAFAEQRKLAIFGIDALVNGKLREWAEAPVRAMYEEKSRRGER